MIICNSYKKKIPEFYEYLLNQLNAVEIFGDVQDGLPWEAIHYHPTKEKINIHTSFIIKLSHELSHMIEMSDHKRLIMIDFGIKKYYPKTNKGQLQSIARESRAKGIQTRLVKIAFGYENMLYHRLASDFIQPFKEPFGRFNNKADVNKWSENITKSAFEEWTEDKIIDKWKHKSQFINDWMNATLSSNVGIDMNSILISYKRNASWFQGL